MTRVLIFFLCAIGVMGLLAYGAGRVVPAAVVPAQALLVSGQGSGTRSHRQAGDLSSTVINRDSSGQFRLIARANGHDTPFLIDTGADFIALTIEDAQEIGIPVDPSTFTPISRTASGTANGAIYDLDELEVAGRSFRNQKVVVLEGLQTNLLGQPILRRMGRVSLQGDHMVIEQE